VDVSATIVDLAVRGHLRIVEQTKERPFWFDSTDWTLERLDAPRDELRPFERRLLDALFEDGETVQLSALKGSFAADYKAVGDALYADARRRRWFAHRPDRVRSLWRGVGVGATVAAMALLGAALLFSTVAVAVIPLVVAGLVLLLAHRWMPSRTATGSRMLDEALGFRKFIETAETGRAAFAEQQQLFVEFLPYAVAFGAVDRWARAFGGLNGETSAAVGRWYVGSDLDGFDVARFSNNLSAFSSTVSGTLPTAPPSSGGSGFSGGSSGGGFGGGGGGSW
jgi:hypothetical protein